MIDSHCHLDLPAFEQDWMAVLARAEQSGLKRILIPGTTVQGWQRQLELAEQSELPIDLAFGLHPYFYPDKPQIALQALSAILGKRHPSVVAVGEIGIDGAIDTKISDQQALFEAQLDLAMEYQLPVILHHRRSHHLIFESLKRVGYANGGIVHAFSGSAQVAEAYIAQGFKLGIGGTITYPRARKTRETVSNTDLSALVLETDSPDMPVAGKQGERNQPENLLIIAQQLADLKKCSFEAVVKQTSENYLSIMAVSTHCK